MDNLLNLGKQAYSAYESSQNETKNHEGTGQGEFGVTGGERLNSNDNKRPGGGGVPVDDDQAAKAANDDVDGDNFDLFSSAMKFVKQTSDSDVDEDKVQQQHDEAYNKGNASNLTADGIGAAAAMQALKAFTSSGSAGGNTSGGSFQSQLIGKAMSEALKLFSNSNASGTKEDAVSSAGQTMMKLLLKNQVSGMLGGGQSAGGVSQLMGMAQQFMK